jgi:hypothetical protein
MDDTTHRETRPSTTAIKVDKKRGELDVAAEAELQQGGMDIQRRVGLAFSF